jgi:hypothetical protein
VALPGTTASADPVTLNPQGRVGGYQFVDLGPYGLTKGSAVNLRLTFNETWSDGTCSFADPIGPVSGTMTVGALSFTLNHGDPYSHSSNVLDGSVSRVQPFFQGTGPPLGSGEFFGLHAQFPPGLTPLSDLLLGCGFTTAYPDGISVTNYGYARIVADGYSVTPAGGKPVPVPATLPMAMLGPLAAGLARRRA